MICNWKYDDIVNLFRPFRSDVWKGMNTEQQEGALQAMLDFYSQRLLGIERLCEVHIRPFGDDKEARYEPSINEIVLREDMAQKGVINCINGDKKTYDHPSKHIFFYMMHEFKHAMQRYYMLNPESCLDKVELMLVQNNQSNKNPNINSYIKPTSCDQTKSSVCLYPLYSIQPIERYAWDFAHKEAAEFEAAMSSLFPDDAAFKKRTKYSSFYETVADAQMWFLTRTPLEDIDNILFTMNGKFVEAPLNDLMCNVIKETQHPDMYQRIKEQLAINVKEMAEHVAKEREQEDNQDVSFFFDDVERK